MASSLGRPIFSTLPAPSPAEAIAENVYIRTEILLRLPVKSLILFKLVSKDWRSLISDPQFCVNHTRQNSNSAPSGIFFAKGSDIKFVSLDDGDRAMAKVPSRILGSCNGFLLCCSTSQSNDSEHTFYVCNPTTKQFRTLPHPASRPNKVISALNLAFNPLKSPRYEAICVWKSNEAPGTYEIEIYSSETGSWRSSGDPFTAPVATNFEHGVFWNGAIHWLSPGNPSLYFDIDTECLKTMAMPQGVSSTGYFGVCCGHLHYAEMMYAAGIPHCDILEMKSDFSGWLVKYTINLDNVGIAFAGPMGPYNNGQAPPGFPNFGDNLLSIIVHGETTAVAAAEEDEDGLRLVLHVPAKIISYNPKEKTSKVLHNLPSETLDAFSAYQYIETLSCVGVCPSVS